MKVLFLSDFHWDRQSKSISFSEILMMSKEDILSHPFLKKVSYYYSIVTKSAPTLLVLCGDVTGDGSCGSGYVTSLVALFKLMESDEILVRFVAGDHDKEPFYSTVCELFANSKFIKEAKSEVEDLHGVKIFGLNFEQSSSKKFIESVNPKEKIDILITHCPHNMRVLLFDFQVNIIVTGHFDFKVINPLNKLFISLSNDFPHVNFAEVEFSPYSQQYLINYYFGKYDYQDFRYFNFVKKETELLLMSTNHQSFGNYKTDYDLLNNIEYQNIIELIYRRKMFNTPISKKEASIITKVLIGSGIRVSERFIKTYVDIE